jgi:FkbM family methyltransferase
VTIKARIRRLLRRLGIDVRRYAVGDSSQGRVVKLLHRFGVDTVLDVGANAGFYAEEILEAGFTGRVLSFEPLTEAHRRLEIRASSVAGWSVAQRMALGRAGCMAEINISANSTSSSILPMLGSHVRASPHSHYVGRESVEVCRLDEVQHPVIEQACSLFVKIDTQGYEMAVLEGAERIMGRVSGLQLEMSLVPLYGGQQLFMDVYDWAIGRGFDLYAVEPGFVDGETGRMLQMDGIFFRNAASTA